MDIPVFISNATMMFSEASLPLTQPSNYYLPRCILPPQPPLLPTLLLFTHKHKNTLCKLPVSAKNIVRNNDGTQGAESG